MRRSAERAAAQQVVDMFATEALLALDKVPAYGASRQSARLLADWWRKLRMDDVQPGDGSGPEHILVAAAEISLDPDNRGLDLREAVLRANDRADLEARPRPEKDLWELRQDFEDAYGGQASVPARHEEWLAQSLTRVARAALVRDVIAQGARVRVSEPLRAAAEEVVRQGHHVTKARQQLAAHQAAARAEPSAPAGRGSAYARQAGLLVALAAYGATVDMSGAPLWAQIALKTPVGAAYVAGTLKNWSAQQNTIGTALDPAQAQLRSVRRDLITSLDAPTPATAGTTRGLPGTDRRAGRDR
jgi:hypothetical protein